jgi:hypothetical protein
MEVTKRGGSEEEEAGWKIMEISDSQGPWGFGLSLVGDLAELAVSNSHIWASWIHGLRGPTSAWALTNAAEQNHPGNCMANWRARGADKNCDASGPGSAVVELPTDQ